MATGYDLAAAIGHAKWLETVMNKPLPAMVSRAGSFPQTIEQKA